MNGLFEAAHEVQQFLQSRSWPFCFIGGLSVIRWGEIRMTQDVDLSLLTGFGEEQFYAGEILKTFQSRIPNAEAFALQYRVLLISTSNGTAVDISFAGLPFEEQMNTRASLFAYSPECELLTCSAEDLIILKAFAAREKDWSDVEGIIIRQGTKLDEEYIFEHLTPFCELKGQTDVLEKLRRMFTQR